MKVYIVYDGEYSDRGSQGVFSTRALAEAYIAERRKIEPWFSERDIEEHDLDAQVGWVPRRYWSCSLDWSTGEVRQTEVTPDEAPSEVADPSVRTRVENPDGPGWACVVSYESMAHALEVAAGLWRERRSAAPA